MEVYFHRNNCYMRDYVIALEIPLKFKDNNGLKNNCASAC